MQLEFLRNLYRIRHLQKIKVFEVEGGWKLAAYGADERWHVMNKSRPNKQGLYENRIFKSLDAAASAVKDIGSEKVEVYLRGSKQETIDQLPLNK